MDFLKRVVPPILSVDVGLDTRDSVREDSPRLLKVKRLSLVSSEKTMNEQNGISVYHSHYEKYRRQELGKVKMYYF